MTSKVKNYPKNREQNILDTVKNYPLYSLNRLHQVLPEVSRHSIQRILEKNNLSTVEKRLAFAGDKKPKAGFSLTAIKDKSLAVTPKSHSLVILKNKILSFKEKDWPMKRFLSGSAILLVIGLGLWQGINFASAKPPKISLDQPQENFENKGERLFVSGRVEPENSTVLVNNKEVFLNGDGTFTAVIELPIGESVLMVEANKMGKKSQLLRLISRAKTEEELRAEQEAESKKKLTVADRAAGLEKTVNDLLAAKKASLGPDGQKEGSLKVLNNQVKEEEGFFSVIGEVANMGEKEVGWVMITATFFNQAGGIIESKYGFATDFGETLKPGEKVNFETQPTKKEFDHYSLELSWEAGEVAGEATPSGIYPSFSGD